jgi:hypothetical protein
LAQQLPAKPRLEKAMHVHGTQMNFAPVNPYAAAAEIAVAKQRAADVRKKLAARASAIEASGDPNQVLLITHWTSAHDNPSLNPSLTGDEYHSSGKVADFG